MSAAQFGPDETNARNKQNVLIAESCQHLKDTASLKPYQNYSDAAMKLLGYHILADVDQETADVSETYDGAGRNLLMSARHVWDEHLQRRTHTCITTLATLHDNLSARTHAPAQPQAAPVAAVAAPASAKTSGAPQVADAAGAGGGGAAAKVRRAYEDLKVEEWMREARLDWETGINTQVSKLDEEIAQVRYKRQCIEHDMAMHKEAKDANAKGLPPPAPRPYAPPPTANQAPVIPPNPVAPPPVPITQSVAPVAQHAHHQPHACAPQYRTATYAAAPRPGSLRPAAPAYAGRAAAAQPLRPQYSTAPTQGGQPRASAGAYTQARPQSPAPLNMQTGAPPVAVSTPAAAAAYASWQAAAAGLPQSTATGTGAAAPTTAAQPAQPAQPAAYNMAASNRPPPTIPNEEAQRRAKILVDAHRAQQAQMNAGRGLQGARGGPRRPAAQQMSARPAMRPPGPPGAPGRATDLSQTGEPVRRGPGRPPGRSRGRGAPGRPKKPSHTVDLD